MKSGLGYLVTALLALAAGLVSWRAGQVQQRVIDGRMDLVTLQYSLPAGEYDEIEAAVRYAQRVPWAARVQAAAREQRAEAGYWRAEYPSLRPERDRSGAVIEQDPELVIHAANAAYRAARKSAVDQITAKQLEAVMSLYTEAVKRNPGNLDVAYNYEFLAHLRDMAAARAPTLPKAPAGMTMHGRLGAPPVGTDMNKFKMVVPRRSDERNDESEAGRGIKRVRRG